MFDLTDKTAIVTGGNGGIGREIVLALASVGATVVSADICEETDLQIIEEIKKHGLSINYVKVDVTNSDSVKKLIDETVNIYGSLDIIVNSAGILGDSEITQISDSDWEKLMKVNLDGTFYCCREAVRVMETNRSGKIINIASAGGKLGFPFAGVHYCSSKGGVMALTRQLALQVGGKGINVNAVAPGTTESGMIKSRSPEVVEYIINHIPIGRMGLPRDTAAAVVFLASSSSNFITGETIDVNGGLYMD
jgi:3-oxoacyl-[acyl-carrier protein] reductase